MLESDSHLLMRIINACLLLLLIAGSMVCSLRIFNKMGFPAWWGLLMFVPLVNLGVLCFAVFKEWPIEQEIRQLELSDELGMNHESSD